MNQESRTLLVFDASSRLDTSEAYLVRKQWNKCSQSDTFASFKADPYVKENL